MADRPDALLKSALEKIVYFEARSEQLSNDLNQARAEGERLRQELAASAQREIELRRTVAELEVRTSRAHAEREELARLNDALKSERTQLIGKVLEASRIHAAGEAGEAESFDLASFIAELREAASAQSAKPSLAAVAPSPARPAPGGVTPHATRLQAQGRLQVSTTEVLELSQGPGSFPGRSEETLFGFSVRELSAPDPASRIRAAERLSALGHPAAAPALASALNAEEDPKVLVALLEAFSQFNFQSGEAILSPKLQSPHPEVRLAALKALVTLAPDGAGPHLAAAMKDPDRAVRRRASLLALSLSGDAAHRLGEEAAHDEDPEVRALGALVLGASGGERARPLLQAALRDPEKKVRAAAAQSLSRLLGEDLSALVDLDEAKRRREVRRIAALPLAPLSLWERERVRGGSSGSLTPSLSQGERVCGELLRELRIAIRGRTLAELAAAAHGDARVAQEACELLVARGQAVKRGTKYFAA
ncbi:MAG: HEAT repeat domain-containing protein [Myxococcota bacterium]